jgi:hypothetical protein
MKYILLLLLSTQAQAGYIWAQEKPPSKSYKWEQVKDMRQVTDVKCEAFTIQQDDGVCVVYSVMSESTAKRFLNTEDMETIFRHEMAHCNGFYHQDMRVRK